MNGRNGFQRTKKKVFEHYKIAATLPFIPLFYAADLFLSARLEGLVYGLWALPLLVTLTPAVIAVSVTGLVVNTAWGIVVLPRAAINDYRRIKEKESDLKSDLMNIVEDEVNADSSSTHKIQQLLVEQSLGEVLYSLRSTVEPLSIKMIETDDYISPEQDINLEDSSSTQSHSLSNFPC